MRPAPERSPAPVVHEVPLTTVYLSHEQIRAISRQTAETATNEAIRAMNTGLLSTWTGIGTVLAIRFLLMLALIGCFALAFMAMQQQTTASLLVLIAYSIFSVVPMVAISHFPKPGNRAGSGG